MFLLEAAKFGLSSFFGVRGSYKIEFSESAVSWIRSECGNVSSKVFVVMLLASRDAKDLVVGLATIDGECML